MVKKNNRVLMAMSGGLDSSIAAKMLMDQSYELVGVTMKTWDYVNSGSKDKENGCCSLDSINDARELAVELGIPHYVLDLRNEFEELIISDFINEYTNGRTPNPCVLCNTFIKWGSLLKKADQLNCYYIATGHYANIQHTESRSYVQKGMDPLKDQSYVIWGVAQEDLKRTLFPLGGFTKDKIREMANEYGYQNLTTKKESYEICFVPDNDYRKFLNYKVEGLKEKYDQGDFVTKDGTIVGKHKGFPYYTIGQRKGLNLAMGEPYYVTEINAKENKIVIGKKEDLFSHEMIVDHLNWQKIESLDQEMEVETKVRYHHKAVNSIIKLIDGDSVQVLFSEDVSAITPGQSAVFYQGDDVIGGGIIR